MLTAVPLWYRHAGDAGVLVVVALAAIACLWVVLHR